MKAKHLFVLLLPLTLLGIHHNIRAQNIVRTTSVRGYFNGFSTGNIFIMADGSGYIQTGGRYTNHTSSNPAVTIVRKGSSLYMQVTGSNDAGVEVEELKVEKTQIVSDFDGWSGATLFELKNGEIWKQDEYDRQAVNSYNKEALIVNYNGKYWLCIEGHRVKIKQLK